MTVDETAGGQWHVGELPSMRELLCAIEDAAGADCCVERDPNPPDGWNLVDESGAMVCSGSVGRLDRWLISRNSESATSTGAVQNILPQRVPGASGHIPAGPARPLPVELIARFATAVTEWAAEPADTKSPAPPNDRASRRPGEGSAGV